MIRFYNAGTESYRFNGKSIQPFDPDFGLYIGNSTGNSLIAGVGVRNTFIGYQAGYNNKNGSNNVFVGSKAGMNEAGSNKLYISNSETSAPLVYGEFDKGLLTVNDLLKLAPRPAAPAIGEEGMIYYDSTTKKLRYYNGTSWVDL